MIDFDILVDDVPVGCVKIVEIEVIRLMKSVELTLILLLEIAVLVYVVESDEEVLITAIGADVVTLVDLRIVVDEVVKVARLFSNVVMVIGSVAEVENIGKVLPFPVVLAFVTCVDDAAIMLVLCVIVIDVKFVKSIILVTTIEIAKTEFGTRFLSAEIVTKERIFVDAVIEIEITAIIMISIIEVIIEEKMIEPVEVVVEIDEV